MGARTCLLTGLIAVAGLWACDGNSDAPTPVAPTNAPAAVATQVAPTPSSPVPPAAEAPAGAELGQPAPLFSLNGIDGKTYALADFKGKTVVLEWFNPDCPFVKNAHGPGPLKTMATRVTAEGIVWLSINSGAPGKQGHGVERNQAAATEFAMDNPILLDESGEVGRAYGAIKTPHMFIVNGEGVLVYRGGIDNAPISTVDVARPRLPGMPEGEKLNYVDTALEDLRIGRPLRLPDTPPYGCSVKYAS